MASEAKQRDHDLLSFMSTFLVTHQRLDLSLTLLSVLIDDASIDVQVRSNKGGYFSVCLARSKDLLEARFLNGNDDILPDARNLPELIAVKIPRPDGDLNSARSRKMWSSMAMELQILRNRFIKNHPNIVQFLGICWKTVKDGVLMPSFVLEAAEIDLEKYLDNPKAVEYRKVLGLAVDIATGVRALHDVGIIHGDIKPANVLIFKDPQLTYVAKIADFGSSLLRSDIKSPMKLSFGSGFWQAPECRDHLDGEQLTKADVYSVGLVLWRLLGGDMMHLSLDAVKDDGLTRDAFFEQMKRNDEKKIPALVYHCLMRMENILGPEEKSEASRSIHMASARRKLRDPKPDEAITLRPGRAVLEADSSMGTLRVLPPEIISNVMREVKRVAKDPKEETGRRTEAAWQYAMFYLRTVQLHPKSQGTIDESLSLLLQAAEGGHSGARGIVSHLYHSLEREFPRSRETELAWLRDGVCHGSETAKRRLQFLDLDLHVQATDLLRTRYSGLGIETPQQYWDQETLSDDELFRETRIRHRIAPLMTKMFMRVAVQALVTSGADPFDLPGLEISYSDTFGGMAHVSPIWFAAMNHQHYMLEILLRNVAKEEIKDFLNTYRRKFGSNDISGQDNPIIAWCVTYAAQGIGRRILLHGKHHQEAFTKTFDILVGYGADTGDIHRLAVQCGQPFVLDYLLGSGKIPKPTPRKWMEFVLIAGATQDWITFDVLLRHSQADSLPPEQWHLYYGSFRGLPNNVEYLDVFRKHRDPKTDFYLHYTKALMSGKFILARWFYDTALHQVAYFPEYQTSSTMANTALRLIVQRWYEPEHLNAQVTEGEFKGRTALHIAALTANVGAVRYLLQEEEEFLDLTLLDCNNFSIVDTAAWGLMSQQSRIKLWDLPTEYHKSADLDHWRNVMEILVRLLKAGAKPHKIGLAVTRTEQEKIQVFDLDKFKVFTVPFLFFGDKFPKELGGDRFWVEVSKLKVDQTFFIASPENLSVEEREAGVMTRVASFY
uniref:Protein kinase domain-containing protein n=1 Tax=Fusarium oxysporum (strain Fo5176) TaxID=660025 RepID=A0A0D2YJ16_FUSOF